MTTAAMPAGLAAYKRTPTFDQDTLPAGLRREHRTKAGVWALDRAASPGRMLTDITVPMPAAVPCFRNSRLFMVRRPLSTPPGPWPKWKAGSSAIRMSRTGAAHEISRRSGAVSCAAGARGGGVGRAAERQTGLATARAGRARRARSGKRLSS